MNRNSCANIDNFLFSAKKSLKNSGEILSWMLSKRVDEDEKDAERNDVAKQKQDYGKDFAAGHR